MTVIISHSRSPSRALLYLPRSLDGLLRLFRALQTAWTRRQTLRALEALSPETLKDIGWPTTDNKATRILRK